MNGLPLNQQSQYQVNKLGVFRNWFKTKNFGLHIMKKAILFLGIISVIISSGTAYAAKLSSKSTKSITSTVVLNPITEDSERDLTITAEIPIKLRVIKIVLFYRAIGDKTYITKTMHADRNGEYRYVISQDKIGAQRFEYYINATKLDGKTLSHGNANFPLVTNFTDGSVGRSNKIAGTQGQDRSGNASDPLWKNKWLWIGVSVLAAAAISNNSGDDTVSKPGFSITIDGEGPQPEPAAP